MPSNVRGQFALGVDPLDETSAEPATIRAVSLVGPEGAEPADACVMGITDMTLVGMQEWPPPRSMQSPMGSRLQAERGSASLTGSATGAEGGVLGHRRPCVS